MITFSLLVLFCACSSKHKIENEESKRVINVDLNSEREEAAAFFDYDHSIVLETTDECLIKQIGKIEFYKENIYILDDLLSCIFVYDKEGKFMHRIERKGDSPEEYISIEDFCIDKETECIYIYDGFSGRILIVDFHGNFQRQINIPKGYSFIKLNNGNWLFYLANSTATSDNKTYNNLLWYDENFALVKEEFPIIKELLGRRYTTGGVKSVFSVYDNQIFFLPLLSRTIYAYNSELDRLMVEYEIRYALSKHNIILDESAKTAQVQEYIDGMNRGEIPSRINNFYEINDAVFFNFSYNGTPLMFFYDKVNDKGKVCTFGFHESGLIFNPPSIYFSDHEDGLVLSIVDSSLFAFCKAESTKVNKIIEDINRRTGNIEDSNPILVFYSTKRF